MLKLMKYEFRKWRTTLLALVAGLAALEAGFLVGQGMNKATMMTVCLSMISVLTVAAFAYLLIAGVASYSQELREKSGYLIFMAPVRPLSVVLSKLLFIALAALAAMAMFGAAAYFDFRFLIGKLNLDAQTLEQFNMLLRFGLRTDATVQQVVRLIAFGAASVLLEVLVTMCTAYLAITLSATLLQNKRGPLRGAISIALFIGLTWGANWVTQKLVYDRFDGFSAMQTQMVSLLGMSALLNAALCALFVAASAWLLDKKVNL